MKQRTHILFLCGWYPSRVLPFNGDFIQRHAETVSSIHKVSVLHIISDEKSKEKIEITSEKINNIKTHIAYIKNSKNPIIKGFRFYSAFIKMSKKIKPFDVVHLNILFPFGLLALYLKWMKKKPFIISEHWSGYNHLLSKKISKTEIYLSKIIAKNSSFICPVSNYLKDSMEEIGLKGKYQIVPNVVDTNTFTPSKTKAEVFTILHVSNMLDDCKNVSGIIKTIKKLPEHIKNFKLIIIGQNSIQFKTLSDQLGITTYIEFIDHIKHQKIIQYMQEANVFVLFSNYENLPCVILESFACGTPVISADVGGISEFFPEDFGFLITPKDENALLEKLIEVYKNPSYNSEKIHSYAKHHFSKNSIAEQFSQIYSKTLE